MKTLHFHTGRGGQFHNPGHVTFMGFGTIQETNLFNEYYFETTQEDIDDPDIETGDREPGWYHANGNELDCEINDDGTGYINADYEYDSDHWVKENDLNDTQVAALVQWYNNSYFGPTLGSEEAEVKRIIHEHYPNYIVELEMEDSGD